MANRFVEYIRKRVEDQLKLFRYLQELIDEILMHQKNWIYLEPILNSQYAMKNLPRESKLFQQADLTWKKFMLKNVKEKVQQNAKVLADDHSIKIFMNLLRNNNKSFDEIQKALDDFLEKKRENFQRFFFLSNDELLEILSTVKLPVHLQPHLRKVFENLVKLEFDNKEMIVAMLSGNPPPFKISAEGESVPIKQCNFRGEVEEWLKILEDSMKNSIKSVMRTALLKYENEDTHRSKWVLEYPSQVVITVDAIQWTKNTEDYLQPQVEIDIFDWYQQNVDQLDELIKLIRGDLTEVERRTLVALVTQDVHFRDIIENMAGSGVNNCFDFKWVQQLRFYWEEETVLARQVSIIN